MGSNDPEVCLSADEAERRVRASASGKVGTTTWDAHVRSCARCRKLMIETTRRLRPPSVVADDDPHHAGEDADALPVGRLVAGRYLVLDVLGRGGMGVVHLAQDIRLQRPVALKLPFKGLPAASALASREAVAMASIDHPNVVRVWDCIDSPEGFAIAMERIDGLSLRDLMLRRSLGGATWRHVGAGLVAGLQAIHEAGLIHGDFKPDNVLIETPDARAPRPRITDFGLAAVMGEGRGVTGGTPRYMAPEVAGGAPPRPASDQYALAATLVELALGPHLFADATDSPTPAVWASLAERLPRVARGPMVRALDADPARRFPSVAAFGAALEGRRRRRVWWLAALLAIATTSAWLGLEWRATARAEACRARGLAGLVVMPGDGDRVAATAWWSWLPAWFGDVAGVCAADADEPFAAPGAEATPVGSPRGRCLSYERALMNHWSRTLREGREDEDTGRTPVERAAPLTNLAAARLCDHGGRDFDFGVDREVPLDVYLAIRGPMPEEPSAFEAAMRTFPEGRTDSLVLSGLIRRAILADRDGDTRRARATLLEALAVSRAIDREDRELAVLLLATDMALFRDMDLSFVDLGLASARMLAAELDAPSELSWLKQLEAKRMLVAGRHREALALLWGELAAVPKAGAASVRTIALLGKAAMEWGMVELAQWCFELQLQVRESMHGPAHSRVAGAMHNLAQVALVRGDRDEARELLARARAMRLATQDTEYGFEKDRGLDVLERTAASMAVAEGRAREATAMLARVTARLSHQFPRHHAEAWETRVMLADVGAWRVRWRCMRKPRPSRLPMR
jgi:hypothetical protein